MTIGFEGRRIVTVIVGGRTRRERRSDMSKRNSFHMLAGMARERSEGDIQFEDPS